MNSSNIFRIHSNTESASLAPIVFNEVFKLTLALSLSAFLSFHIKDAYSGTLTDNVINVKPLAECVTQEKSRTN